VALLGTGDGELDVRDDWVSRTYGRKEPSSTLVYRQHAIGRQEIVSCLIPNPASGVSPAARRLNRVRGGRGLELTRTEGADRVLWGDGGTVEWGEVRTDAEWLWLRQGADGEVLEYVALEVAFLTVGKTMLVEGERRQWCTGTPVKSRTEAGVI
jgi:hypothetical protein